MGCLTWCIHCKKYGIKRGSLCKKSKTYSKWSTLLNIWVTLSKFHSILSKFWLLFWVRFYSFYRVIPIYGVFIFYSVPMTDSKVNESLSTFLCSSSSWGYLFGSDISVAHPRKLKRGNCHSTILPSHMEGSYYISPNNFCIFLPELMLSSSKYAATLICGVHTKQSRGRITDPPYMTVKLAVAGQYSEGL